MQHLEDIDMPKAKDKIIQQIRDLKINAEYLEKSKYYTDSEYNIKERIVSAKFLKDFLESQSFNVSIFKCKYNKRTKIKADYLIISKYDIFPQDFYIFIRKRKGKNIYCIVSCFLKNKTPYYGGKRYVMLREKITSTDIIELFRHPNFSE